MRSIRRWGVLAAVLLVPACGGGGGGGGGASSPFRRARGFDERVFSISLARDGSGDVFAAGFFRGCSDRTSRGVVRLDADGRVDAAWDPGTSVGGAAYVVAAAADGSGDLFVGGTFASYDGEAVSNFVRLNADGSRDLAFVLGAGFNDAVYAILPLEDGSGKVYVAGEFGMHDGVAAGALVRLNADGTRDTGFSVLATDPGVIRALAFAPDGSGDLYVGGHFFDYGTSTVDGLVRLNSDGSVDAGFAVASFENGVSSLAPARDGSGDLYVGGSFGHNAGGKTHHDLIRFNSDGSVDLALDQGIGFNTGGVTAVVVLPDHDIVATGDFPSFDGTPSPGLVRLNPDGSRDPQLSVGAGFWNHTASLGLALAEAPGGDLYVGGHFVAYQDLGADRLIRLDADGSRDPGFETSAGFEQWALAVAEAVDGTGDLYVGGEFYRYDGRPSWRMARLNPDGTFDADFDIGTGFNGRVNAVAPALDGTGDVYAGGSFTNFDGTWLGYLVRVRPDGQRATTFALVNPSNEVHALAAVPGGDVYVGGVFGSYGAALVNGIFRANADGTLDAGFDMGTGVNGRVWTIVPAADGSGDIYIGGEFTTYDGASASRIARIDSDGTLDVSFAVGAGFNGTVRAILPVNDGSGDLYVGGVFTTYQGGSAPRILRVSSTGSVVGGFAVGAGFDGDVYALAAGTATGRVVAGGVFQNYQGVPASRIARLKPDGSRDADFAVGSIPTGSVNALLAGPGGATYAAGTFLRCGDLLVDHFMRIERDGTVR